MFLFNYRDPNLIKNDKVSAPTPKQPQFYFFTSMTSPWRDLKINLDSEIPNESEKIAVIGKTHFHISVQQILKMPGFRGRQTRFREIFPAEETFLSPENTERTMMLP